MKPGDVVQLKSGGPKMTVTALPTSFSELSRVECVWFAGTDMRTGVVPASALVEATEDAVPAPKPEMKIRRCACGHPLSRHNNGVCISRDKNQVPCSGKCRLIEAGEE